MDDNSKLTAAGGDTSSRPEDNPYVQSNVWKVVITFAILLFILIIGAVKYLMR